jgi:hypothetical protein
MSGALKLDGLDEAIIGVTAGGDAVLVYDYDKLVDVFCAQGMDTDEAQEWVHFNIIGAYMGEGTPIIVYVCSPEDALQGLE